MRVLLFGASGGIGRHVREQARAAGHELVLFARDPAGLEPVHAAESVIVGDIDNTEQVERAVADVDAVISVLGPTENTAEQVERFEGFARTLVDVMSAKAVRRLVTVSGGACTMPGERKPLRGRVASAIVRLFVPHVVAAKQRELEIVARSDLDWIAPRPARVVTGEFTGTYHAGTQLRGMRIRQADLADFMVGQLTDDTYLRQAPFVSS